MNQKGMGGLAVGHPGDAIENGGSTLVVAFPIVNENEGLARNVIATAVRLAGAGRISPARLPLSLGAIRPDGDATVYATFQGRGFVPGHSYLMTVTGTYLLGDARRSFALSKAIKVPPASPGEGRARRAASLPHKVNGVHYPHRAPAMENDPNPDRAWKVPTSTVRHPLKRSKASRTTRAPVGDPPGINFLVNDSVGVNGNTIAEPSGGTNGSVVFETANSYAAYSTTNGSSFTQIDPTTIFPNNADGGFCCDQIVQYVPSIDRVVWVMQFGTATDSKGNVRNRYRIASASPGDISSSGGTSWTYWDITSGQLGIASGWLDYPDLAVGANSLYLSYDQVGVGRAVIRIPLSEIQAGTTINFWFTDPNNSPQGYGGHLTQQTGDEIFWAGPNSNSSMRVFSWQETSGTYFWRDIGVGTWPNGTLTSSVPDGNDWLTKLNNFPGNALIGGTRVQSGRTNQVWFAWSASSGQGFPMAQVQWVSLDRNNNFSLISQGQIWNPSYAFAYPAICSDEKNETGLSLEYGGPSDYESPVVGVWGDFVVYITSQSDVGTGRFGDYVTIRRDPVNGNMFDAFDYALRKPIAPSTTTITDARYVVYGH